MTHSKNEITADLIAELLREQHPDLTDLPLTFGADGWDNQLWRLGGDLAIRLPWASTRESDDLILKEHAWLPVLAPRLPVPTPVPQRLGLPSERFPHPWIVTTWVTGEPADRAPATRDAAADTLAAFLAALHRPAPEDAPAGRNNLGGPLAAIEDGFAHLLEQATDRDLIADAAAVREVWEDALAAPAWTGPALWLHGDLHPANLLTRDGDFCGVIDFGDLCTGDPACDLAACWALLPAGAIDRFQQSYPAAIDAETIRRARGWAVTKALVCLLIGDNGVRGVPGGKATWGSPADAALRRLVATRR